METQTNTFIIPARRNQISQKNNFSIVPVRQFAIAMNTNFEFTDSYTENPFRCQKFDRRQIRMLEGSQPIVDFDAAADCCLYVTTMNAMKFQDDIPSIPNDPFKDHYVLVFDLTSV